MKNAKRLLSAALVFCMIFALAACGGGEAGSTDSTAPAGDSSPAGSTDPGAEASPADPQGNIDLEPVELTIALLNIGNNKDLPRIQEKINVITKEKINATVNFLPIDEAVFTQQVTLMISGNEDLDLMTTGDFLNYHVQAAQGQLVALEDLLPAYAPSVLEAVPDEQREACVTSGHLYSVPTVRDWAADFGYVMPKSIAEKYDLLDALAAVKTPEDLTPIFEKIVAGEGIPAVTYERTGSHIINGIEYIYFDPLGDYNGALLLEGDGKTVVNKFATDEYKQMADLARQWNQMGAIPKDLSSSQVIAADMMRSGAVVGMMARMKPGFETKQGLLVGQELVAARFSPALANSSTIANIMYGVPVCSKNPERAVMMMDLLYSDADIMNLLSYGEEGTDYVALEDGTIGYPEGMDSDSATYSPTWGWLVGNQLITKAWAPDPADIWEQQRDFNLNAEKSPALGFAFNTEAVKTEIAAVENVKSQYERTIGNGDVEPDSLLPKFLEDLEAAGLNVIIEEKQRQLDEWYANR